MSAAITEAKLALWRGMAALVALYLFASVTAPDAVAPFTVLFLKLHLYGQVNAARLALGA